MINLKERRRSATGGSTVSLSTDRAMDRTHHRHVRFSRESSASSIHSLSKPKKSCMTVATQQESLERINTRRCRRNGIKKELQFDTIEIREYKRTVGDNPSCSSGPPLAIEWEYDPEPVIVPVEEFEDYRPPRRSQFELMLGRDERHEILEDEWEIPPAQIAHAIRQNIKAKNQRLRTLNNIGRVSDMEEKVENVKRKLKMPWKKKTSKEAQDLATTSSAVSRQQLPPPQPTSSSVAKSATGRHNMSRERRREKNEDLYPDSVTA